ncbi:MAG TPA: TonB-dependent receptor [Bradyrhizobium sp.]|nr:TonB-dependent receptor [Bradyrhizobium sp.]
MNAAQAQQSASPDVLPPVEVSAPGQSGGAAPAPASRSLAAKRPAPARQSAATTPQPGRSNAAAPVVVSPTATVTPASEVASSVTVITDQEIQTRQYRSVPDVLDTVPGLNVVQSGGPGGQASVFMRGTNSNHTKVLIDGIDVSDPSNPNGAFDFAHLLTSDIQQMEILRGPQSGLYGSDAIGGVISIITQKGDGPPRATATIETGSFGTFNQGIGLSGSQDNFNYAFNVAHLHASDVPVTPLQLLPPGQQAIGNNYDNMTYSTKFGVDLNEDWALNTVVRYTDATLLFTGDSNNFPSSPNAEQSTHAVHQLFAREEAVWSLLGGRVKNYFGVNYANNWSYDIAPADPAATITTGERLKYDWHAVAEITGGNNLIVGLEDETDHMDTADFSADTGNKAGYIELQSQFARHFFLTANVRDDFNDQFGEHTTYRIAPSLIVPVTGTTLKASYGSGFKAPTLSELYQNFPDFNFFANPNLKPEQSVGSDIGFEQPLFNDRVRFGSTYFHNNITDLITDNATFTSYANVGLATTEGTENFISAKFTDRLTLRADYTFTRAVDASTGIQLLRRPKEKWSTTAIWKPIDPLTLSATVLHVGSFLDVTRDGTESGIRAPGYTIVNLTGDYAASDQIKVFARIDNLFNLHYQNPTGFLQPGLGVFGGIRFASYDVK